MNQWEIEERAVHFANHPVLGEATRFLNDYKDVINANSDGWAYWSIATDAAKKLVELVYEGTRPEHLLRRDEIKRFTQADVKKAVIPIKSFCTRKNLPCPRAPYAPIPAPEPVQYKGIVDGMTQSEAQKVLAYATANLGAWATFSVSQRTEAKPGFPAGYCLDYSTKIDFHDGQAVEVKAYCNGFLAGLRA